MRSPAYEAVDARSRPIFGAGLLLTSSVALLLPAAAAAAAIAVLTVLWWSARLQLGKWLIGTGLGLSAVLLSVAVAVERWPEPGLDEGVATLASRYGEVWDQLDAAATTAAAGFQSSPPQAEAAMRPVFERFQQQISDGELPELTLRLIDPDGNVRAWAGEGLRNEPEPYGLPRSGHLYRQGYTAATVLTVVSLSDARRPWKLLAGLSFDTAQLPFSTAGTSWPQASRWSLGESSAVATAGWRRLAYGDAPAMFLRPPEEAEPRWARTVRHLRKAALIILGFTLFALPILQAAGLSVAWSLTPLLMMAGFGAWGAAARLPMAVAVGLIAAVGIATWALARPRKSSLREGGGELAGALVAVALTAAAWWFQNHFGRFDLAAELGGSGTDFALRLTLAFLALGALRLCGRRLGPTPGDGLAWLAAALLVAAGAFHDLPALALPLAAAGAAITVRWLTGVDFRRRPAAASGFLVLAAILAAVCWETASRQVLRSELEHETLPKLSPPTAAETNEFLIELFDQLEGRDLAAILERPGDNSADVDDLAYRLWRESPLPERDGLSALVVEPLVGVPSAFSFGLSLEDDYQLAPDHARWQVPAVAEWQDGMIFGESRLTSSGRLWGHARYWFLPRPGFRLEVSEVEELDGALVRGELHRRAADGLPESVLYGLYTVDGEAVSSPWRQQPALPPEVRSAAVADGRTQTPDGRAWFWAQEGVDGISLLYLPALEPLDGLERIGVHALSTLALIALIGVLTLLFSLPRNSFGDLLERSVRSYSKRMILVFTGLLLLPLVALNLFLLRDFESRLQREQQLRANDAIVSAGDFILDYLAGLEPGSSIETRLDRGLLEWVASIVHHQVNLYWRSELYTSSQRELFTTGLLPARIPGDVYSRLALEGSSLDYRTRRRGDLSYREYYAPLHVPGLSTDGFSLSVPIVDQEEDDARELAGMRRRALLVTTALFVILAAVGSRLAQSFTQPIMELIQGTRRIADGAAFLDVTPREHELSSLADAIDEMARSIAEGRRRLLLEKQLVERIVDNIAAAVVSLDRELRVRLQNQVAEKLLGTEIGGDIQATLERDPQLGGVVEFLRGVVGTSDRPQRETLQLQDAEGEGREWSLIWVPLPGEDDPVSLLVVDDVTEVVRGQRLQAWAEMARIIAHEIKNPLTPIQLSTEHMRQVYTSDRERFGEVLERCTDNILDQVEELRDIASEFSAYSRIPQAELTPGDLVTAMRELTETYVDARRHGVEIELVCDLPELPARFDKKLLGRAVRNLLENALRASAGRGRIEVGLERHGDEATIRVADSGPGVDPAHLHRIFEPYFSTHESGTGLGLAITRRIIEEHGGRIDARNRDAGGLEVTTTLPLTAPGEATQGVEVAS